MKPDEQSVVEEEVEQLARQLLKQAAKVNEMARILVARIEEGVREAPLE